MKQPVEKPINSITKQQCPKSFVKKLVKKKKPAKPKRTKNENSYLLSKTQ